MEHSWLKSLATIASADLILSLLLEATAIFMISLSAFAMYFGVDKVPMALRHRDFLDSNANPKQIIIAFGIMMASLPLTVWAVVPLTFLGDENADTGKALENATAWLVVSVSITIVNVFAFIELYKSVWDIAPLVLKVAFIFIISICMFNLEVNVKG